MRRRRVSVETTVVSDRSRSDSEKLRRVLLGVVAGIALATAAKAQSDAPSGETPASRPAEAGEETPEILDKSLEELMNIDVEVTSVSKKSQKISSAPAAIFVVSHDDIKRLGARSVPEALRIVPGLHVAQIDQHNWAVTSRGFNSPFANKLLVLIDGRAVYTPLFAGTFWNQQNLNMEDIERIEVIRGPGATLWGANAVNGVINIITRTAAETQGGFAEGHVGSAGAYEGALRYGFQIDEDTFARLYATYFQRNGFVGADDRDTFSDFSNVQSGFRVDSKLDEDDSITVQGDVYSGRSEEQLLISTLNAPFLAAIKDTVDAMGANVVMRWTKDLGDGEDLSLQFYWDYTERIDANLLDDHRHTLDLDFDHRFRPFEDHEVVWGLGARFIFDDTGGTEVLSFEPADRDYQIFSAFVQDEVTLIDQELKLTFGSKFEHNSFSGFEVQPSARLMWTPNDEHSVWAAFSRAVRTPSRTEHDLRVRLPQVTLLPATPPIFSTLRGNGDAHAEELMSYELGWRFHPVDNLVFDLALFHSEYNDLNSLEVGAPTLFSIAPPLLDAGLSYGNEIDGQSHGLELSAQWQVFDDWRLNAAYTLFNLQIDADHTSRDSDPDDDEGLDPAQQFNIRSYWDFATDWQFNTSLLFVDAIPQLDIEGYVRLDFQIRWRPCESADVAIGVQNLLDDRHPEYTDSLGRFGSEVERIFYVTLGIRF